MIRRGDVHWVDLGEPDGSKPSKRRPVIVVQADSYNASRLATFIAVVVTSNTELATMPGNVFLPSVATGLPRDSVANVSALTTSNKRDCEQYVGTLPGNLLYEIDRGLRKVLAL